MRTREAINIATIEYGVTPREAAGILIGVALQTRNRRRARDLRIVERQYETLERDLASWKGGRK